MAVRHIKVGTEVRVQTTFGGRVEHGIVTEVTTQDAIKVRVGHSPAVAVTRLTGPGARPNRFSVPEP